MEKTYKMYGTEYTIITCTAIALCDEENEASRQDGLMVTSTGDSGERFEYVVFGWEVPETSEGFNDMLKDDSAWETMCEEHRIKTNMHVN